MNVVGIALDEPLVVARSALQGRVGGAGWSAANVVAVAALVCDLECAAERTRRGRKDFAFGQAVERTRDRIARIVINDRERVSNGRSETEGQVQRGAGQIDGAGDVLLVVAAACSRAVQFNV